MTLVKSYKTIFVNKINLFFILFARGLRFRFLEEFSEFPKVFRFIVHVTGKTARTEKRL